MANDIDFSKLSDEQLESIIAGEQLADLPRVMPKETAKIAAPEAPVDPTMGMPPHRLALAGVGSDLATMWENLGQKGRLGLSALPGGNSDRVAANVNAEREARTKLDQMLMSNPSARLGSMAGKIGLAAATPARLPAQMGMAALDAGTSNTNPVTGPGSELMGAGFDAAKAGLVTGALGKPMEIVGKGIGGARGQYTDPETMALYNRARGEGIPLSFNDLAPGSKVAAWERNSPRYADRVRDQAKTLDDWLSTAAPKPGLTPGTTIMAPQPGARVTGAIDEGARVLEGANRARWKALDDYVANTGMERVVPNESFKAFESAGKTVKMNHNGSYKEHGAFDLIDNYDPQSAQWIKAMAGADPKDVKQGVPFEALNQMRIAIGKAYNRASRDVDTPNGATFENLQRKKQLGDMYHSIGRDLESWGQFNTRTKEAKSMFDDAIGFYRDRMVPDVTANKAVVKGRKPVASGRNAFPTSAALYEHVGSPINREGYDRVIKELPGDARLPVDLLRAAKDARSVITRDAAPAQPTPSLASLAGRALRNPMITAGTNLPIVGRGVDRVLQSNPAKQLYFGKNAFNDSAAGRAMYGSLTLPGTGVRDSLDELIDRAKRGE